MILQKHLGLLEQSWGEGWGWVICWTGGTGRGQQLILWHQALITADSPGSQVFPSYVVHEHAVMKQSMLAKLKEKRALKQVQLNGGHCNISASFRHAMWLAFLSPASKIRMADQRATLCHAQDSSHRNEGGPYFLPILQDTESWQLMTNWWQHWCSRWYLPSLFLKPPIYVPHHYGTAGANFADPSHFYQLYSFVSLMFWHSSYKFSEV